MDETRGTLMAALGLLGFGGIAYLVAKPGFYGAVLCTLGTAFYVASLRAPLRRDMAARAVLMAFYMPVAAWLLPNVWMLYALMACWVPLFAGRLEQVAGVYLFSLLMLPGLEMPVDVGGTRLFDLSVHDALAVGGAAAICANPRRARVAPADDLRLVLLAMVLVFAYARGATFTHILRTAINVTFDYALPYYILSRGLNGVEPMRAALRWLACAGVALGVLLMFEAWHAWPMYNELYNHYGVPIQLIVKTRGSLMRAAGPFTEPTSMALVMSMCLFALWLTRDDFRTRGRHAALCLISFLGVSAPQSRNAWVGLALAMLLADVFTGRWQAITRKLVLAAMAGLALLAASAVPTLSESLGMSGQGSDTAVYRRNLLRRGTEEFVHSPLIGYPSKELSIRLQDMRQGEGIIDYVNTYLWFALISGGVGLAIFMAALFTPLVYLWRLRGPLFFAGAEAPAAFIFGCLAMLATTLCFTAFGSRPAVLVIAFIGFAAALRAMARRTVWENRPGTAQAVSPYAAALPV